MKRSKIILMSKVCLLLILESSIGHAKSPPREIVQPAGTNKGQVLQVAEEDSASLTWGDIVKKDSDSAQYCPDAKDGEVCMMNQYKAEQYCKDQHKRLPTAREQAQWSQDHGAKGIQETAPKLKDLSIDDDRVDAEIKAKKNASYYPIYKKNNAEQMVVDFYFNKDGYKPPEGDLGKYWTWSLSIKPSSNDFAYDLKGDVGNIGNDFRGYYDGAVRCVTDRAVTKN